MKSVTERWRTLVPVLPSEEEFPYAIRTVSETFESNGSTSQASICASSMSLMAAGVPIKSAVAGISCGLVTGESDDDYIVLTDIQGLEDFFGPKCQRRFAPCFHNLNAPFPAFFPVNYHYTSEETGYDCNANLIVVVE